LHQDYPFKKGGTIIREKQAKHC